MPKEPYVKPEVKSEVLEPGALGCSGSPAGCNHPWIDAFKQPSCDFCCDE